MGKEQKSKISFQLSLSELREAAANAEQHLQALVEKGLISYAGMSTKGGESQVDVNGNIDIGVSVDGGGQVVIIVISVLVALVVILLIVYFSCKRGCVCCDNLCCGGRCHKSEREQKQTEEQNKQLQQQLNMMNTQLRTMQAVQTQQMMIQAQPMSQPMGQNQPMNFQKPPVQPVNPNQLSIQYPQHAQVSHLTPSSSPYTKRRDRRDMGREKSREPSRAPSSEPFLLANDDTKLVIDKRNEKYASNNTVSRYPDRVESPVAKTSGSL